MQQIALIKGSFLAAPMLQIQTHPQTYVNALKLNLPEGWVKTQGLFLLHAKQPSSVTADGLVHRGTPCTPLC